MPTYWVKLVSRCESSSYQAKLGLAGFVGIAFLINLGKLIVEHLLKMWWIVGSIPLNGFIKLFLVLASDLQLVWAKAIVYVILHLRGHY